MKKYRARHGRPVLNRRGLVTLAADEAAPNAVLTATMDIDPNDTEINPVLTVSGTVTADYAHFLVIFLGEDASGNRLVDSTIVEAASVVSIPNERMGIFANSAPTEFRLCVIDIDGSAGFATGTITIGDNVPTFEVTADPVLAGPQTEGVEIDFTPPVWTGSDEILVSYVYSMAEDNTGTNDAGEVEFGTADLLVPQLAAPLDHFRIGAKFEGPGVPDEDAVFWSDYIEIEAEAVVTPVTVARAPMIATQSLAVDGVTAAFVAGETVTSGSKSAVIVAYVVGAPTTTGTLYLGTITNGPFADNDVLVSASGAGIANGASAAYPFSAGQNFYTLAPSFNGTPTTNVSRQEIATDSSGTGAVAEQLSGVMPARHGSKYYALTHRYTGYQVASPWAETTTGWIAIGVPTLAALTDAEWAFTTTTVLVSGVNVARLQVFRIPASLGATELWWTTGQDSYLEANPHPVGREQMTLLGTEVIEGVTWQRWQAADAIANGKNFRDFGPSDVGRNERLGVIARIGGALSPVSVRKAVTIPDQPTASTRRWVRAIMRTQGQADTGEPGGTGMQFPRAFDVSGNYVYAGFDITWPMISTDFGENYSSDRGIGLTYNDSFMGAEIDPDGKYVHVMAGGASMMQIGNYGDYAGIYRLNRDTNIYTFIQPLADVYGTNMSPTRWNTRYIAIQPGSGTSPDTRTVWAVHAPAAYSSGSGGFSSAQLYRSTDGGASYSTIGSTLGKATIGIPLGILCNSAGIVYLYGDGKGMFRRKADGTWVKASFPTEAGGGNTTILCAEVHGNTIYAGVKGKGIYTATDAETLSFTRLGAAYNLYSFSVCPTNTDRILRSGPGGSNRVTPERTTNGGSSWADISTQKFDGQFNDFEHFIHEPQAWFKWHDTDPNLVIAMRYHHMGKSTDGGATFYWSSRGFDYSGVKNLAFSTQSYRKMFMTCTDRLNFYTNGAFDYCMDDAITNDVKDDIFAAIGAGTSRPALTASGALILENGVYTRLVNHIGERNGDRAVITNARTVTQENSGTGNGTLTVSASQDFPDGWYYLRCTTAGGDGVGIFTGTGPRGLAMGTWTVGTEREYSHPNGGTLTLTFNDGSTNFAVGKTFTIRINHLGEQTVLSTTAANMSRGDFGSQNPADPSKGFTGRQHFVLSSGGVLTRDYISDYEVIGYGGTGGSVVFGVNGNSAIRRSTDEGQTWGASNWFSGSGTGSNFGSPGVKSICASSHDDQRCYFGNGYGEMKKVQNGTATVVFDFLEWLDENNISVTMAGANERPAGTAYSGQRSPWVNGVAESYYDPNVLFCTMQCMGFPYQVFRTANGGEPTAAVKSGGNTGNGTIGTLRGSGTVYGTYTVTFTNATAFSVTKPDGTALASGTVGNAFSSGGIGFTITAGGTAFVSGDGFTISYTKPVWENITGDGLIGPAITILVHPVTDEPFVFSRHGTVVWDVGDTWRTTHSITASIAEDMQAMRGTYVVGV